MFVDGRTSQLLMLRFRPAFARLRSHWGFGRNAKAKAVGVAVGCHVFIWSFADGSGALERQTSSESNNLEGSSNLRDT